MISNCTRKIARTRSSECIKNFSFARDADDSTAPAPVKAGIQVTDSVRHAVERRYPGEWMPDCVGMTELLCA
jgi:hypothetical protein